MFVDVVYLCLNVFNVFVSHGPFLRSVMRCEYKMKYYTGLQCIFCRLVTLNVISIYFSSPHINGDVTELCMERSQAYFFVSTAFHSRPYVIVFVIF